MENYSTPLHPRSISVDGNFSRATAQFSAAFITSVRIFEFLNNYYMPAMIFLGLIGNGLSFVAFFFTPLRLRSSSCYLGCLAVSDFGYLVVLFFVWLTRQGVQVMNRNGLCQMLIYLSSTFSCWSVWLTVSFTAERYVAVNYPLWRLQLGTTHRARMMVGATLALSLVLNAYLLVVVGVIPKHHVQLCELLPTFSKIMHYINVVDTVVTLVIPVAMIIYMNFMIGRALYLFYSHHRSHRTASIRDDSSKQELAPSERPLPPATQVSIARMLLLVSSTFLLLNLPSYVTRLHGFVLELRGTSIAPELFLLQRFFMLFYYTNFAINFVLYNVSSRMFRKALRDHMSKSMAGCCVSGPQSHRSSFG